MALGGYTSDLLDTSTTVLGRNCILEAAWIIALTGSASRGFESYSMQVGTVGSLAASREQKDALRHGNEASGRGQDPDEPYREVLFALTVENGIDSEVERCCSARCRSNLLSEDGIRSRAKPRVSSRQVDRQRLRSRGHANLKRGLRSGFNIRTAGHAIERPVRMLEFRHSRRLIVAIESAR